MLASHMQAGHGILCVEDAMGLPKYAVTLSDDERSHLRTLLRRGTVSARRLLRARILLTADDDRTDVEVAEVVGVGIATELNGVFVGDGTTRAPTRPNEAHSSRVFGVRITPPLNCRRSK